MFTAERYHDISCGHRVHGHESKCAHFHGHNYRIHFYVEPDKVPAPEQKPEWMAEAPLVQRGLDDVGRVMDFSVIKSKLCMWVEEFWDHKFLMWLNDPALDDMCLLDPKGIVACEFNPTAENMAKYLVEVVGPMQLAGTGCRLTKVRIEETMKCAASYEVF